jgi:hypothetical protein
VYVTFILPRRFAWLWCHTPSGVTLAVSEAIVREEHYFVHVNLDCRAFDCCCERELALKSYYTGLMGIFSVNELLTLNESNIDLL